MQIDLMNIEINPTDGQYGASVLCVTDLDGNPRSLLGLYWYDRTVYASVAFFAFTWVCLWGYKPNTRIADTGGANAIKANAPHQARAVASRPECGCSPIGGTP